jgi:DHA3 family tetracycline resistance protein-like MFS transporter
MSVDQARLFVWSGLIWQGALRAYWVSLVVRITIELGLPSLQLVLLGTAMELALLLAEVPTGVVADAYSRKWSVVIGFVGVGLAQVAAGLVEGFGPLVGAQVLWGVAYTFRSGAETAWVTDELGGAERVEPLLLRRARLQLVVSIFSIAAGAALARLTSLSTSVVLSGIVLIVTGALLAVTMTERAFVPTSTIASLAGGFHALRSTLTAGARVTWSQRSLQTLVAVLVIGGLAGEAIDRLDIRRLDDLGLSSEVDEIVVVGVIASVEAALGALVLWWSQPRLLGRRVTTGLGTMLLVSAVGVAALGLVAVLPVAIAGLVLQGGLRSAARPLATTWTNAHAPSQVRATVHSFVEQANSIGEIGGGVALGALAALTTVPTAMAASVVLIGIAGFVALSGRRTWSS